MPQGSVLGPILFLVYINDLEEGVTGNILKFADDTVVESSGTPSGTMWFQIVVSLNFYRPVYMTR